LKQTRDRLTLFVGADRSGQRGLLNEQKGLTITRLHAKAQASDPILTGLDAEVEPSHLVTVHSEPVTVPSLVAEHTDD
jgi:hypothetical protein